MDLKSVFQSLPDDVKKTIIEKKKKGLPILRQDIEGYIKPERAPSVLPEKEMEDKSKETTSSSFLKGALEGATFNFADEMAGAVGKVLGKDYKTTRDIAREELTKAREEAPVSNILGNIAGGIATTALGSAAIGSLFGPIGTAAGGLTGTAIGVARQAPKLWKLGKTLLTAGSAGALYGAGEAKELEDVPEVAKENALLGIAATGALGGAKKGLGKVTSMITDYTPKAGETLSQTLKGTAEKLKEKAGRSFLQYLGVAPTQLTKATNIYQVSDKAVGALDKTKKAIQELSDFIAKKDKEGVLNIAKPTDEIVADLEKHIAKKGEEIGKVYQEVYKKANDLIQKDTNKQLNLTLNKDEIIGEYKKLTGYASKLTKVEKEPIDFMIKELDDNLTDLQKKFGNNIPPDELIKTLKAVEDKFIGSQNVDEYFKSGLPELIELRKSIFDKLVDKIDDAANAGLLPENQVANYKDLASTLKTLNREYHQASTLHTMLKPTALRAAAGGEGRIWAGAKAKLIGTILSGLGTGLATGSLPAGVAGATIALASMQSQAQLGRLMAQFTRAGQLQTAKILETMSKNLDRIPEGARNAIFNALNRSPKSVIATHYLLMKNDPEYSKIIRDTLNENEVK